MALPAPTATLILLARRGWTVLVAALLTLLLGWCALHEGRGPGTADGLQAQDGPFNTLLESALPWPAPVGQGTLPSAACLPETSAHGEPHDATTALHPVQHGTLVAHVPLWPTDALRWQPLEPSLRLNPGHAPPDA